MTTLWIIGFLFTIGFTIWPNRIGHKNAHKMTSWEDQGTPKVWNVILCAFLWPILLGHVVRNLIETKRKGG